MNKWKEYKLDINSKNGLFFIKTIKKLIISFWRDVVIKLDKNQYIRIQFKVYIYNKGYKSISYVETINKLDLRLIIKKFFRILRI